MEEKCKSCSIDDIGCGVIKQLRKDILKIKVNRSCLHVIALLICSLGFIIAGLFAFRTFCPAPSAKNVVYNIKISGEKNISGDVKAEIKKELAEALIEVENRAVAAYNEKFTILLTVLTIFGIAWPLVVAILQLRFNEGELKKIKEAEEKANAANNISKNMNKQMKEVNQKTNELLASSIEIQLLKDDFKNLKYDYYSEMAEIFSVLSLIVPGLSGAEIFTPIDSGRVSALFCLNKLFYLCHNDLVREDKITQCCKTLIVVLEMLEAAMNENKEIKMKIDGEAFREYDWDVIKMKINPDQYKRIRELCDKVFLEKGER